MTFRRFFKKRFLMSHFFPPKKKTLPGTKAATNPEVAKAQLHPLPGRVSQGVIHSTGRSDRLHAAIAKRIFFMDFFGCW